MENGEDVMDMISSIDFVLKYAGLVGQVPRLHPWLAGNQRSRSSNFQTPNEP